MRCSQCSWLGMGVDGMVASITRSRGRHRLQKHSRIYYHSRFVEEDDRSCRPVVFQKPCGGEGLPFLGGQHIPVEGRSQALTVVQHLGDGLWATIQGLLDQGNGAVQVLYWTEVSARKRAEQAISRLEIAQKDRSTADERL